MGGAVSGLACLTNLMSESESGRGPDILKLRAQNLTRMNNARREMAERLLFKTCARVPPGPLRPRGTWRNDGLSRVVCRRQTLPKQHIKSLYGVLNPFPVCFSRVDTRGPMRLCYSLTGSAAQGSEGQGAAHKTLINLSVCV